MNFPISDRREGERDAHAALRVKGGRPLRFLAAALGGWVAMRILVLSPYAAGVLTPGGSGSLQRPTVVAGTRHGRQASPAARAVGIAATDHRRATADANITAAAAHRPDRRVTPPQPPYGAIGHGPRASPGHARAAPMLAAVILKRPARAAYVRMRPADRDATFGMDVQPDLALDRQGRIAMLPPLGPAAIGATRATSHAPLSVSGWLLARGGASGTVSGGQLGASQAGVRAVYGIDPSRRLGLTARLAAPLEGRGREAALGIEWRPTRWPVRLIAEQRFVLDGGRGGPTVGVIAGYGPAEIAPGARIETYGQAGAIMRDGVEGFVDAGARLTHGVAERGRLRLDAGVGAWVSAQRGATRGDIGPSLGLAAPLGRRSVRLALDWRQRIAGTARPGSGPALSVGSDF
ncbi:hypothetical protein [Sphingomonas sp. STIS6.2]|uniref:hypothetical protein n=1 Tax=Sphingomonas sp. STIS6.2 TaxID=1379700 RepID=UPI001F1EE398|nr:hypothetical protein [Sphingomonas sp. STIS6.2]